MLFDKKIIFSLVSTICILSLIILSLGVNPLDVLVALYKGSVGNTYFLKQTLMTSGILMLTALAAVIPFLCCSLICLDRVVLLSSGEKLLRLSPLAWLVQTKLCINFVPFNLGSVAKD